MKLLIIKMLLKMGVTGKQLLPKAAPKAAFAKSRAKTLGSLKTTRKQDLENPARKFSADFK